ncbi:MAG: hypothetical protein WBR26_00010 [Candidatus Acidiferrum sp.]
MKNALYLLLMTIFSVALACATASAAATDTTRPQQPTKVPAQEPGHAPLSEKNHPSRPTILRKAPHPQPLPNSRTRPTATNITGAQRSASSRPRTSVNGALRQNESVSEAKAAHAQVTRPAISSPTIVRHRSSNPATPGGSTGLRAVNTGSLNGTRMSHRP